MHRQLPPEGADELVLDSLPFAGAANTESCSVCFLLAHFGQTIAWFLLITICS